MSIFTSFIEQVKEVFEGSSDKKPEDQDDDFIEQQLANEKHRYDSFAAVRHDAQVKFFIDGQNYCWAVSEAIENAKECIYIEDWWLVSCLLACGKSPFYINSTLNFRPLSW